MLLVPTQFDSKTGSLTSVKKIPAGKKVWKFALGLGDVKVIAPEFCVAPFNEFVKANGFQVAGSWFLSLDDSRFVAHVLQQERPLRRDQGPNLEGDWSVWKARREIKAGEALTIDRLRLARTPGPPYVDTIPKQSPPPSIGQSHPSMGSP